MVFFLFYTDSFEYTPHIVSKIVNGETMSSLRFTHDSYIINGKVIIGYVEDICEDAKCVKVNDEKVKKKKKVNFYSVKRDTYIYTPIIRFTLTIW